MSKTCAFLGNDYDKICGKPCWHHTPEGLKERIKAEIINLIKNEDVDHIIIKHFYCPECGEELISKAPPMFNPYTFERICLHECKCGKRYNLDYAYPRFVLINKEGDEINAYGI